jgi:hypothetical protein
VSDWLDDFQMMGAKLNEGEKSLMRFAINKEQERILKLIRDRVAKAKEYADNGQVTAMQRPVSWDDLYAISEAIIYGIKGEQK